MKNTHNHRKTMTWQSKSAAIAIAIMAMSLHSSSVQAMPEQGKVVAGQGEIARPDEKTMVSTRRQTASRSTGRNSTSPRMNRSTSTRTARALSPSTAS